MKTRTAILALAGICVAAASSHAASMKEAVRQAVMENPTGRADAANIRAVAGELKQSQTAFAPTVDVFGDAGYQRRRSPTASTVSTNRDDTLFTREIGVRASLLLFDGLERANIVYRNAARLDGATYHLLSTSETLALNAVEAYIDVVRHQLLMAETRTNIQRHNAILSQIRERVSGGKSPVSDRTQIEERVFAAKAVAVEVQNALQDAEAKYRRVTGHSPSGVMRIPRIPGLPKSKKSFVWESVANNYSIKQAQKAIREFEYEREASRAGILPRVSLDGRASKAANRSGTTGRESDLYVGLTLSWRLYDGGLTNARERTSAERISEAEFRYDAAVRDVTELAENSWNSRVNGSKRNSLLRSQVNTNESIVESYRSEYILSKRSLLDVLDAERARFNAKFQQISAQASANFASFRMLATMSKLAAYFGVSASALARTPDVEEQLTDSTVPIFDITIEPLQ
ncbi:MAG: TolC family protein [Pseudomonadota bacterium]